MRGPGVVEEPVIVIVPGSAGVFIHVLEDPDLLAPVAQQASDTGITDGLGLLRVAVARRIFGMVGPADLGGNHFAVAAHRGQGLHYGRIMLAPVLGILVGMYGDPVAATRKSQDLVDVQRFTRLG